DPANQGKPVPPSVALKAESEARRSIKGAVSAKEAIDQDVYAKTYADTLAKTGDPVAAAKAGRAAIAPGGMTPAKQAAQLVTEETNRRNAEWDEAHKDASPGEKAREHYQNQLKVQAEVAASQARNSGGTLSPEAVDLLAKQYIAGNYAVITALPRAGTARVDVEKKVAEYLKDNPNAVQVIQRNRLRAQEAEQAARTAGRITMNTELYTQEAERAGAEVIRTSKLVPRSEFPNFNAALLAAETGIGKRQVV